MSIISLIILLVVVGVILWAINTYIPMEAGIKKLLNVLIIVFMAIIVIVFLLNMLGISTGVSDLHLR